MSKLEKIRIVLAILVLCTSAALVAMQESAPTGVVINEVELNPAGFDTDKEWVELLNRGDTAIDISGWTLSFSYRGPGTLAISEAPQSLSPGARYVFVFPGLRLRNAEGTPIRLYDAEGILVDETPSLIDPYDDDNTWQRWPDGGDPAWPGLWLFREATRSARNE